MKIGAGGDEPAGVDEEVGTGATLEGMEGAGAGEELTTGGAGTMELEEAGGVGVEVLDDQLVIIIIDILGLGCGRTTCCTE